MADITPREMAEHVRGTATEVAGCQKCYAIATYIESAEQRVKELESRIEALMSSGLYGWQHIRKAPTDGTSIVCLYDNGEHETIRWSSERSCMLATVAPGAGILPAGWVNDENLPVDPPFAWKPVTIPAEQRVKEAREKALEEAAVIADGHWPESGHVGQHDAVSCQMSISILIRRLKKTP